MIPHILLVDDDADCLDALKETVLSYGYTCDIANGGEEALRKTRANRYQLVLTDLNMPDMPGDELIENILKENSEILCMIISAVTDLDRILPSLNEHKAYYFISKPVDSALLKVRIDRSFEVWQLRSKLKYIEQNEMSYYQQMMEIFDWKKELQSKKFESFAAKIVRQMNIGLFHGGGIGGLLTTISLVLSKAKINPESKKYELSEKQFNLLKENYQISRDLVNGFTKAQAILMDTSNYSGVIQVSDLNILFEEYKRKLLPMWSMKNQRLIISSLPSFSHQKKIYYEQEIMESAMKELLINAMKYSEAKDSIYVIFFVKESFLEIKILNPAYPNQDGTIGITGKNEMMVFEPFFRLSTVSNEGYHMEEFGAGIGLSVVKKIMQKHNADISIITIKNHTAENEELDVSVTIRFPYLED